MTRPTLNFKLSQRKIIILVIALLAIYVIVPQLGRFRASLTIVRHIQVNWLLLAILLSLVTYTLAAASYYLLAKSPLRYPRTIVVQGASMFANHIFPAGLGNIGVNFVYLRKNKHSNIEAGSVIAVNNVLGLLGHLTLLAIVLFITHPSSLHLHVPHVLRDFILIGLIIVVLAGLISLYSTRIRNKVKKSFNEIKHNILSYSNHRFKLLGAFLCVVSLTTLYALCLGACAKALGLHLNFTQSLIVLTIGVAGATLTPTPGGVIGVEAGLGAALVACGLSAAAAVALVLTYRFVTYWLAILIGLSSFIFAEKEKYI